MKIKTIESKVFKPITIEITFENDDELCNFWHRLNSEPTSFSERLKEGKMDDDLFIYIDNIVEDLGLRS